MDDPNWAVIDTDYAGLHVVPLREDHDLTTACPCGPRVEILSRLLVTHNSHDGREAVEWAQTLLAQ